MAIVCDHGQLKRSCNICYLENEIKYLEKGIKLAMEHTYDDDTHEFLDRLLKHDVRDVPEYRLKIE